MSASVSLVESHIPPHDLDAEAAVLSAVMNDRAAYDLVADLLKPDQFFSEAHRQIFAACVAVAEAGKDPDIVTVASQLREAERLSQVGGLAYITTVLNAAPALANTRAYAETVHGLWKVRQTILVCLRGTAQGYAGAGDPTSFVSSVADAIFAIECSDARGQVGTLRDAVVSAMKAIQEANASGKSIIGLPTGFHRYDRVTSGLHGGELTIVAARPGMGKTAFVLDVLLNVCGALPAPGTKPPSGESLIPGAVMFSLEMPREQIAMRMLASAARIDLGQLRTGSLSLDGWKRVTAASARLADLAFRLDDTGTLSMTDLRARVRRTIAEERARGVTIVLVVIDYLQLLLSDGDNREQEIASISRGLKRLAKELGLPVLALAQLNRAVETRANKRPMLSDLRESGAIEQDADNVTMIYRDDYYDNESEDRNVAELILAKQRNGPTTTVRVRFDASYTRFDNLAEEPEYEGA